MTPDDIAHIRATHSAPQWVWGIVAALEAAWEVIADQTRDFGIRMDMKEQRAETAEAQLEWLRGAKERAEADNVELSRAMVNMSEVVARVRDLCDEHDAWPNRFTFDTDAIRAALDGE